MVITKSGIHPGRYRTSSAAEFLRNTVLHRSGTVRAPNKSLTPSLAQETLLGTQTSMLLAQEGLMKRARSVDIYLKPGIDEDDQTYAVWQALRARGRPQDVFRRAIRLGLLVMADAGELPRAAREVVIKNADDLVLKARNVRGRPVKTAGQTERARISRAIYGTGLGDLPVVEGADIAEKLPEAPKDISSTGPTGYPSSISGSLNGEKPAQTGDPQPVRHTILKEATRSRPALGRLM